MVDLVFIKYQDSIQFLYSFFNLKKGNKMSVVVKNKTYPTLGNVTLYYSDNSNETKSINSLGNTVYDGGGSRVAVRVAGLGYDFYLNQLPQPIMYPVGPGSLECAYDSVPTEIHWDSAWGF